MSKGVKRSFSTVRVLIIPYYIVLQYRLNYIDNIIEKKDLRLTIAAVGFISETSRNALRVGWVTLNDTFVSFSDTSILTNSIELEISVRPNDFSHN